MPRSWIVVTFLALISAGLANASLKGVLENAAGVATAYDKAAQTVYDAHASGSPSSGRKHTVEEASHLVESASRAVHRLVKEQQTHPQDFSLSSYEAAVKKVHEADACLKSVPHAKGELSNAEGLLADAEERLKGAAVYQYHGAGESALHELKGALEELEDANRYLKQGPAREHGGSPSAVLLSKLVASLHRGVDAMSKWADWLHNVEVYPEAAEGDATPDQQLLDARYQEAEELVGRLQQAVVSLQRYERSDPDLTTKQAHNAVLHAQQCFDEGRRYLEQWQMCAGGNVRHTTWLSRLGKGIQRAIHSTCSALRLTSRAQPGSSATPAADGPETTSLAHQQEGAEALQELADKSGQVATQPTPRIDVTDEGLLRYIGGGDAHAVQHSSRWEQAKEEAALSGEELGTAGELMREAGAHAAQGVVLGGKAAVHATQHAVGSLGHSIKHAGDSVGHAVGQVGHGMQAALDHGRSEAVHGVQKLGDVASHAAHSTQEALEHGQQQAQHAARAGHERVQHAAHEAREALHHGKQAVAHTIHAAGDGMRQAAHGTAASVAKTAERVGQAGRTAAELAKEGLADVASGTVHVAQQAAHAVGAGVQKVQQGAKSAAESAAEKAQEAAHTAKQAALSAEEAAARGIHKVAEGAQAAAQKGAQAAGGASAAAKRQIHEVAETLHEAGQAAAHGAGSAAHKAAKATKAGLDKARELEQAAAQAAAEKVKQATAAAKGAAQVAGHTLQHASEVVQDSVEQSVTQAAHAASSIGHAAQHGLEHAAGTVHDATKRAQQAVKDAVHNVPEKVHDVGVALEDVAEQGRAAASGAKADVSGLASRAVQAANGKLRQGAQKLQEIAEKVTSKVEQATQAARQRMPTRRHVAEQGDEEVVMEGACNTLGAVAGLQHAVHTCLSPAHLEGAYSERAAAQDAQLRAEHDAELEALQAQTAAGSCQVMNQPPGRAHLLTRLLAPASNLGALLGLRKPSITTVKPVQHIQYVHPSTGLWRSMTRIFSLGLWKPAAQPRAAPPPPASTSQVAFLSRLPPVVQVMLGVCPGGVVEGRGRRLQRRGSLGNTTVAAGVYSSDLHRQVEQQVQEAHEYLREHGYPDVTQARLPEPEPVEASASSSALHPTLELLHKAARTASRLRQRLQAHRPHHALTAASHLLQAAGEGLANAMHGQRA